ncbi:MAG: hypothetical protein J0I75_02870, partial [Hyphomicrobium sp.]|nr:hypothetical protein [Hyphomicrobium sp.]
GWLLFAPYFLLNALTFGLYRLLSREPAYAQVALQSAAVSLQAVLSLAALSSSARSLMSSSEARCRPQELRLS